MNEESGNSNKSVREDASVSVSEKESLSQNVLQPFVVLERLFIDKSLQQKDIEKVRLISYYYYLLFIEFSISIVEIFDDFIHNNCLFRINILI